jgi:hypothetical protein
VPTRVRTGGSFHATTKVAERAPYGRDVVTARCGGANLGVSAWITVQR